MPIRIDIEARVSKVPKSGFSFQDLHRLACYLMEDEGQESHAEQDKHFTIHPPLTDSRSGFVDLRLHTMRDDLMIVERLRSRLDSIDGRQANLGRDVPLIEPSVVVSGRAWRDLLDSEPRTAVAFETLSPVLYNRSGKSFALPEPWLVMSQLIRRWNAHTPIESYQIPIEAKEAIIESVYLMSFDIRSRSVNVHAEKTGFVGNFTLAINSRDDLIQQAFSALCTFAEYSGMGALTTSGLGAVRTL